MAGFHIGGQKCILKDQQNRVKLKKNLHRAMASANQGRHCAQYIKKGGLVIQKSVICSWIENQAEIVAFHMKIHENQTLILAFLRGFLVINALRKRKHVTRYATALSYCTTQAKGPSIKYVSTFFAIFDNLLPHVSTQFLIKGSSYCKTLII